MVWDVLFHLLLLQFAHKSVSMNMTGILGALGIQQSPLNHQQTINKAVEGLYGAPQEECGILWVIFTEHILKGTSKSRSHYSASRGTSQIQFWWIKQRKNINFMVSGLLALSPTFRNPYFLLWSHQIMSETRDKSQFISNTLFGEIS